MFPSNYVVLVEAEAHKGESTPPSMASRPVPVPGPEPDSSTGDTAIALYDYDAAEANEISFPDGAIIENIVSLNSYF